MPRGFGPSTRAEPLRVSETMLPLADYADRRGYDPGFILSDRPLPLPGAGRWAGDLVTLLPEARRAEITQWLIAALNSVEGATGRWALMQMAERTPDGLAARLIDGVRPPWLAEVASGPAGMVFSARPSGLDVTGSLPVLRLRPSIRE